MHTYESKPLIQKYAKVLIYIANMGANIQIAPSAIHLWGSELKYINKEAPKYISKVLFSGFFFKIEFHESLVQTVRFGWFWPVPAGSVPGLEKNPVLLLFFADRTGQPCKSVRPTGFASSSPVSITLVIRLHFQIVVRLIHWVECLFHGCTPSFTLMGNRTTNQRLE